MSELEDIYPHPINYGKLGVEQGLLQKDLQEKATKYVKYRIAKIQKKKVKREITLNSLEKQQVEINDIRRKLGLKPINLIRSTKWQIKQYEREFKKKEKERKKKEKEKKKKQRR